MTHYPQCPGIYELEGLAHAEAGFVRNCQCALIARVLADACLMSLNAVSAIQEDSPYVRVTDAYEAISAKLLEAIVP